MKKILLPLFAGMVIMISCKDKKQTTGNETQEQTTTTADPAKDSAEIRVVVTEFL